MTVQRRSTLAEMIDAGNYPRTWDDFVGQEQAKRRLRIASRSAHMRKEAMEHILIRAGAAGVGKTSLALLAAQEMETNVTVVSGPMKLNEARIMLARMDDFDVLFYDEIHQAVAGGKGKAEWLLHLLQDGVIVGPRGAETAPKITVIGATTDAGRLPKTILGRFLECRVVDYTPDEGIEIVKVLALRIIPKPLPLLTIGNCVDIAQMCSNNPREMRSMLLNLRDIAMATECSNYANGEYDLTEAMDWMGLTSDGLTAQAQSYLKTMFSEFQGIAGEKTMVDRLNEPGGLAEAERLLMDKGMLIKGRTGRELTQTGVKRALELLEG